MFPEESQKDWKDLTEIAGPALLGVATGLILGDMMHGGARRGLALGLAALGIVAIAPSTVEEIKARISSPTTKRGSQKRLNSIREAGAGNYDVEEELLQQGIL